MLAGSGRGVGAAGVVLYGAGVWLGYPEVVTLGFVCLVTVAAAVLWTLPRPHLEVERALAPRKVARDDPAEATVTLRNAGRRVRAGLQAVDVCGGESVSFRLPMLAGGGTHEVSYLLPTRRRGEVPVGPVQLVRSDPLGLARRVQRYGDVDMLLVRPRTCGLPLLPSGRDHHVEGPTSSTADDGTITFHALREYVIGDDLRRVHWRYTARTGTLMVRQMVDVSLPHTTVVLDNRPAAYSADGPGGRAGGGSPDTATDWFELAVDVAASVGLAAARSNFPVHLVTADGALLQTAAGDTAGDAVLDRLARLGPSAEESLAGTLEGLGTLRGGGTLVVISGRGDTSGLGRMSTVRSRFERAVLILVGAGPAGASGPVSGTASPADLPVDVTRISVTRLDELVTGWRREAAR